MAYWLGWSHGHLARIQDSVAQTFMQSQWERLAVALEQQSSRVVCLTFMWDETQTEAKINCATLEHVSGSMSTMLIKGDVDCRGPSGTFTSQMIVAPAILRKNTAACFHQALTSRLPGWPLNLKRWASRVFLLVLLCDAGPANMLWIE